MSSQPRLETGETGIDVEAGLAKKLLLARGEYEIEVSEGLVAALGAEEGAALEGGAVGGDSAAWMIVTPCWS